MHLKQIKLAGFKSFVDPTTVTFPSNLCAVVGPNGCGKSNIIDAVRWVMGESSAKNLRGESMTDVIFNGSSSRKPVGQASIELVFDNSDRTLKGEYAGYNEIAIRRKVTRDGQNNYYLNGTKCRRRDIVDIFLGTGLGPRSYAIIEQGMISRLIEAKPEELRVYIEEAAGISKYKERRRDTENRMRRTHENLERLTDIREELERQLVRLERQAKSAEKYAEFKQEERDLKAQLAALRYRLLDDQYKTQQKDILQREVNIESFVTEQVNHETSIEKYRTDHTEYTDKFNEVQGRFYGIGTEIARLEQSIQHIQERNRQLQDDMARVDTERQSIQTHLQTDQNKAESWEIELLEIEPELEQLQAVETDSGDALNEVEEAMQLWQQEWDEFNQIAGDSRRKAEVEQSRIQHLEQVQTRLLERIKRLDEENAALGEDEGDDELPVLEETLAELEEKIATVQSQLEELDEKIENLREKVNTDEQNLNQTRGQLQTAQARLASLEALQQGAMAGNKKVDAWLSDTALDQKPKLLSQITVESKWQNAVEIVLDNALNAVCVDNLSSVTGLLDSLEQGTVVMLDKNAAVYSSVSALDPLVNYVGGSADVNSILAGIYTAPDLAAALSMRDGLSANESVVTPEGLWVGKNWMRVKRVSGAEGSMLARQNEIESLTLVVEETDEKVALMSEQLQQDRETLKGLEQQREQSRRDANDQNRQFNEQRSKLTTLKMRVEQASKRRQKLQDDKREAKEQMDLEAENLAQSRLVLQEAIDAMTIDNDQKDTLLIKRDDVRGLLDNTRQRARQDKDRLHSLAMRHQSIKTQLDSIRGSLQRLKEQSVSLESRREQLLVTMGEGSDPTEEQKLELEALLEKRIVIEEDLSESRRQKETAEQKLRDVEQARAKVERELQALRDQLTQARIAAQTVQVQRETIAKQLLEDGLELEELLETLAEDASEKPFEEELVSLHNRITRLGPINLAAIDEYKIESERKNYLDAQNGDLQDALETLENAILKIDRETRTRFKETFDAVNTGMQELFPKVFGGGHAYLELTGDDFLDTGVAIMARPPGKRNSTIHLLSGGEKALTAISMVFAIFRLNPAPFCMLDEVDAPLDDANVGRYANLVKEMSDKVQFICITHNKIAMEVAHQLLGVTMHEAGCSRLVAVDVNEAAELAAS